MRIFLLTLMVLTYSSTKSFEVVSHDEWTYIFDGKTFNGWHLYNSDSVGSQWSIENGELILNSKNDNISTGNDLLTENEYTSFELSIEWNISKGGNSGVFYGVKEFPDFIDAHTTGPEIQVLDNTNFNTSTDLHKAPSLYDLVSSNSKNLKVKPHGQWNHLVLKIDHKNNLGTVELNGQFAFSYPLSGPDWDNLVSKSKFNTRGYTIKNSQNKRIPTFGTFKTGKIALQDHGSDVKFRNIKIREF